MKYVVLSRKAAAVFLIAVTLLITGTMTQARAADATSSAGLVSTATGGLNVRSAASPSGVILTKLASGTYVTLLYRTGNWWRIEYAPSTYGYASADYIQMTPGTYPVTVSSAVSLLNVRSGPSTAYPVIGTVPGGRSALVLSESGGWNKILVNGTLVGYVSAKYLNSATLWPVPQSRKINQYFSSSHNGIDIGSSVHGVSGDSIVAAMSGKVVYAGILNGYGYVVYINSVYNGQPIQMRYGHLQSTPLVQAGTNIGIGQLIGYMGSTGESTGAHLHFEVRIRASSADCIANADSIPVNPLDYVK